MRPKKQKKIIFNNTCGCIVDYLLLQKAMEWYASHPLSSKRKIYLHGRYPGVSIYEKKIHVHRLIGLYLFKEKVSGGIVVHHKNHDVLDCTKNNLILMSNTVHGAHHGKGRKLTKENKEKLILANKKRKGTKIKRKYNMPFSEIMAYLKKGYSINRVAVVYGCDWSVIKQRIHENPELSV